MSTGVCDCPDCIGQSEAGTGRVNGWSGGPEVQTVTNSLLKTDNIVNFKQNIIQNVYKHTDGSLPSSNDNVESANDLIQKQKI